MVRCCAVPARHRISGRPEPRLRHPSDQGRVNNDPWATDHGQRGMLGISLVDKRRRGGGMGIVAGGQGGLEGHVAESRQRTNLGRNILAGEGFPTGSVGSLVGERDPSG